MEGLEQRLKSIDLDKQRTYPDEVETILKIYLDKFEESLLKLQLARVLRFENIISGPGGILRKALGRHWHEITDDIDHYKSVLFEEAKEIATKFEKGLVEDYDIATDIVKYIPKDDANDDVIKVFSNIFYLLLDDKINSSTSENTFHGYFFYMDPLYKLFSKASDQFSSLDPLKAIFSYIFLAEEKDIWEKRFSDFIKDYDFSRLKASYNVYIEKVPFYDDFYKCVDEIYRREPDEEYSDEAKNLIINYKNKINKLLHKDKEYQDICNSIKNSERKHRFEESNEMNRAKRFKLETDPQDINERDQTK